MVVPILLVIMRIRPPSIILTIQFYNPKLNYTFSRILISKGKKLKILAIEKEIKKIHPSEREAMLKKEASVVWRLYQKGIVREIYFDIDDHIAVLILECKNKEEANKTLTSLPLVKEGYITFELNALVPYSGFERLMCDDNKTE